MSSFKALRILSIVIITLTIVTSTVGLFWDDGGSPFYLQNVYGEDIKMFGNGLYSHDTFFAGAINKGTDATTLFIVIPLFLGAVILNKKDSLKFRLLHLGLLSYLLYYSASLSFGVAYNVLFIVYVLLFSSSLFAFILGISGIDTRIIKDKVMAKLPHKGVAVFMIFAGLSVFVWLIEIISSIISGKPPAILDIYTTMPTFVKDLGIIGPSAFICSVLILKRKPFGYILAPILLTLNAIVGVLVVSQSIFQKMYGVNISMEEFIAYVGVFVLMSIIAIILDIRVLKNIEH